MNTTRVAMYARISTTGQDCEVQLRELREYCERRGFEVAGETIDKGISGSRERRSALDQLMASCRKRLVDAMWQRGGGRRKLSVQARARIAAAQKARWAKWKKAQKAA